MKFGIYVYLGKFSDRIAYGDIWPWNIKVIWAKTVLIGLKRAYTLKKFLMIEATATTFGR